MAFIRFYDHNIIQGIGAFYADHSFPAVLTDVVHSRCFRSPRVPYSCAKASRFFNNDPSIEYHILNQTSHLGVLINAAQFTIKHNRANLPLARFFIDQVNILAAFQA